MVASNVMHQTFTAQFGHTSLALDPITTPLFLLLHSLSSFLWAMEVYLADIVEWPALIWLAEDKFERVYRYLV